MNTLTNTKPYYFKTLYNNYVTAANEAYDRYDIDKTVKLSLSSLSLNFTFNGSNYESNRIIFSGVRNLNITTNVGSIYKSGSTFKVIMSTTSGSAITLSDLEYGIYTIKEMSAPSGCVLNKEKVKFEVKNDTRNIEVEMVNQL